MALTRLYSMIEHFKDRPCRCRLWFIRRDCSPFKPKENSSFSSYLNEPSVHSWIYHDRGINFAEIERSILTNAPLSPYICISCLFFSPSRYSRPYRVGYHSRNSRYKGNLFVFQNDDSIVWKTTIGRSDFNGVRDIETAVVYDLGNWLCYLYAIPFKGIPLQWIPVVGTLTANRKRFINRPFSMTLS